MKITGGRIITAGVVGAGVQTASSAIVIMDRVVIDDNRNNQTSGASGGGVAITDSSSLTISNSTVSNNQAVSTTNNALGGGLAVTTSTAALTVINSTISSNLADGTGSNAYGGGINSQSGSLNAVNATISNNTGDNGAGIRPNVAGASIENTIIAANNGPECAAGSVAASEGHNLSDDSSCNTLFDEGTDIENEQSLLSLVLSDGVHLPTAGSPALDAGNAATCAGLTNAFGAPITTDQRGQPRVNPGDEVIGAICDIGSVEFFDICHGVVADLVAGNSGETINGDANANVISGGGGDDTINGGEGADTICAGPGGDTVDGGGGIDLLTYESEGGPVVINLANGTTSTGDIPTNIEDIVGTFQDDTITGSDGPNWLRGNFGNDVLIGGLGNDFLEGQDGTDTASYPGAGPVVVNLQTGLGAGDNLLTMENVRGSSGADKITGNSGPNKLEGLGGNDVIDGKGGSDNMIGGNGTDTVSYSGATAVTLNLATGANNSGDSLSTFENAKGSNAGDTITGRPGNNKLEGLGGADTLNGGGGNDILLGGSGNGDTLNGGDGNDALNGGSGSGDVCNGQGGTNDTANNTQCETITGVPEPFSLAPAGQYLAVGVDVSLPASGRRISKDTSQRALTATITAPAKGDETNVCSGQPSSRQGVWGQRSVPQNSA